MAVPPVTAAERLPRIETPGPVSTAGWRPLTEESGSLGDVLRRGLFLLLDALLLEIGASAGTVQRIIMSEGVAIGILSWVLAAAIGLPLSKLLSAGVGIAFGGEPLSFEFSVAGMAVWLGLAVLIASVSSYLPARRASRMSVREALDYE